MGNPAFVYVTFIAATPERVFDALTNAELTKDYWVRHRNASPDWRRARDGNIRTTTIRRVSTSSAKWSRTIRRTGWSSRGVRRRETARNRA